METNSRFSFPFASLLVYSPKGSSEVSAKSRRACYALKQGDPLVVKRAVARMQQEAARGAFPGFFEGDVALVPAPGSALPLQGGLHPPLVFAQAMCSAGVGRSVLPCLARTWAVPKSSFAAKGERTTFQRHLETIQAMPELLYPSRLVIVDDVVTKGATLLASAVRLQEAFPRAEVRCFALVRTKGLVSDVDEVVEPCVGEIRWDGMDVWREP